jgi:hypothetical protein
MQNKKKILPKIYNFLGPKHTKNLVRFGVNKDGGYIIDSVVINKINHLVSFGMAEEFSFEIDFLNDKRINTLQIYDHTVNHKNYILRILKVFRRVITFRKNIKDLIAEISKYIKFIKFIINKRVNFYPLKIVNEIKNNKEIDLDGVFSKIDKSINDIAIKIDIEGDEYNIMDKIIKYSKKINIIIIEFHNINKKNNIFLDVMKKLVKIFDVIHIHGNNHELVSMDGFPNVIEITLVNKKNNLDFVNQPMSFPIKGLDFPNNPLSTDIEINFSE